LNGCNESWAFDELAMFSGVFTAIVTPVINSELDEESLRGLIEFQIAKGIDGIVPCGTTGESPTLGFDEYKRVVGITVETARKQVPVVAGAGSNATAKAVELTRCTKQLGVDATLQVTPDYNKPTPDGLYQHFKKVAEVGLPLVIYNVPGRTSINITPETAAHLSKIPEEENRIHGFFDIGIHSVTRSPFKRSWRKTPHRAG